MNLAKIPVILFTYNRPIMLHRTLMCLRENEVQLLYIYCDGAKSVQDAQNVSKVRQIVRDIDWCEKVVIERNRNFGLGKSILEGVTEVLQKYEAAIVFEDDLICVPGTYEYLCAALRQYAANPHVMSVTGWVHPKFEYRDAADQPYFDGRAECWVWGTWARVWAGMNEDAKTLLKRCENSGIDVYRYGADLVEMAEEELNRNIWAVRFLYWHIFNKGLCLRPPWSLVEHIGWGGDASNAGGSHDLSNLPLRPIPPLPVEWPEARENQDCSVFWGKISPRITCRRKMGKNILKRILRALTPPIIILLARNVLLLLAGRRHSMGEVDAIIRPEWEHIPNGWAYLQKHPEVKGWNVESVVAAYREKWAHFNVMIQGNNPLGVSYESNLSANTDVVTHNSLITFGYCLALAGMKQDRISVLDWGGGLGHYYCIAKSLIPEIEVEYHCREVPLICQEGRRLNPNQFFYDNDSCLSGKYNFVMASAALHYSENWQELLGRLARSAKDFLFIASLPVVQHANSFVFVQRPYSYGYNTEYVGWCVNRSDFMAVIENVGWELRREFIVGHKPLIHGAPEQNEYRSFLFVPKNNTRNNEVNNS